MMHAVRKIMPARFGGGSHAAMAVALGLSSLAGVVAMAPAPAAAQGVVPTPESWFGHRMGTDRKLEPYDRLMAYYQELAKTSDRIKVQEIGKTSEGRPYLALFVSSPANLARLDEYRQMNLKLADPRGVPKEEIDRIVREGKAVIAQSYDMHSTEIGSSLTAVEFTYNLVSKTDPATMAVLDNVISIIMPSANPDGHEMVQKFYTKYLGTPYEGGPFPTLYQKYVGHDNNRDAFMLNLPESRNLASILYRDWIPEAYIDHHQMGNYSARISIPPYTDPIRPGADPLVWREMTWYGADMAYKLDEADLSGGMGDAIYSGWGHFGFHWITPFHNITGMLDESAGANIATPLYVHPDQLKGGQRNVPDNTPQMNMPNPWPGGWWRPRDIVNRQLVTSRSLVEMAAKNRETVLRNMYLKAQRQTDRGAAAETKAYVIDAGQHDPLTVAKMVNALLLQKVDVYTAPAAFTHEGRAYAPGSFVVPMNQPNQGLVRYLLGRTFFPDDTYARTKDGTPIRPYDMATDTLTEFMGVESVPAKTFVTGGLTRLAAPVTPRGTVSGAGAYLLDGALNDSFHAANLAMRSGASVRRLTAAAGEGKPGDFVVTGASPATAESIAATTGVSFAAAPAGAEGAGYAIKAPRIGIFTRYRGGNYDGGWTQLLFEQFGYASGELRDAEIRKGNLNARYDVIILPTDSVPMMTGEAPPEGSMERQYLGATQDTTPPEYRSGFGEEGVKALEAFVKAGGKIVTFGGAADLPIKKWKLPVKNVVGGKPSKEFWSPGSTLNIDVNNANPLAYGMPDKALAIFTADSQAFETVTVPDNQRVQVIATYAPREVLRSGWLLGEDLIKGKAAMVSVDHGKGKVVMIGFRPQHRAQAHGTFKLLFDSILTSPDVAPAS